MAKNSKLIDEFKERLENSINNMKAENESIESVEKRKEKIGQIMSSQDKIEAVLEVDPIQLQELADFASDSKITLSDEELETLVYILQNETFKERKTKKYKRAVDKIESLFPYFQRTLIKRSDASKISSNKKAIDQYTEVSSHFEDGKVSKVIADIEDLIPIIDLFVPNEEDREQLLIDICVSNADLLMDVLSSMKDQLIESQNEVIDSVSLTTDEPEIVSENTIEATNDDTMNLIVPNSTEVKVETEDTDEPIEELIEDTKFSVTMTDEQKEIFNEIRDKINDKLDSLNIEETTVSRIAKQFLSLYLDNKNTTLEDIKTSLPMKSHYEAFLVLLMGKDIKEISEIVGSQYYDEDDVRDFSELLQNHLDNLKEVYENEFKKLNEPVEEILPTESTKDEELLPVIFVDGGKPFEKSLNSLGDSKENVAKTIESLRQGHYHNNKLFFGKQNKSKFYIKGADSKVIYKVFDNHIIIHSVVDTNSLDKTSNTVFDCSYEENLIRQKNADYRKSIKNSSERIEAFIDSLKKGDSK